MPAFQPYEGHDYLDFPAVQAWIHQAAAAFPDWLQLEQVGTSRQGRPLFLLTLGERRRGDPEQRPALWLDAGTHASELTGVMAVLYGLSRWLQGIAAGEERWLRVFSERTVYCMPCLSPDGFQHIVEGKPFLRSTLRPPREGTLRQGFEAADVDGDGAIRWMRWKHPAGPFVHDPECPLLPRHRRLDDDPADAFFLCSEGHFVQWDGHRWVQAPRQFGHDLNRNFPASWEPFSMFGMDGGAYPLSEPESRAAVDAFAARPNIAVGLTNHTYTGALLTQPYRAESPLPREDIELMEAMATDACRDTGYRALKVHPDFTYDKDKAIVGVWADAMSCTFGVPGYTLELWDPYGAADTEIADFGAFFRKPDPQVLRKLVNHFAQEPGTRTWTPFEHPQLGAVELGGLDYLRTIRNPPVRLLAEECHRATTVAERLLGATAQLQWRVERVDRGELFSLVVRVENLGFLPTATGRAEELGQPGIKLSLELPEGMERIEGLPEVDLGQLDGWGSMRLGGARHPVYAGLNGRGHRAEARWLLRGEGTVQLRWQAGRAGSGELRG